MSTKKAPTKRVAPRRARANGEQRAEPILLPMLLRISERYTMIRLLPDFGSIEEVTNIGIINETLKLDAAERIKWAATEEAGAIFWDIDGETEVAMTFEQWRVIEKGAKLLDQRKKFPSSPTCLAVYLRLKDFIEEHSPD